LNVLMDSSSLINLSNAGILDSIWALERCNFFVTPLVIGECNGDCSVALVHAQEAGQLEFLNDNEIDADHFLNLLHQLQLGVGETECIAAALGGQHLICCDDRKARSAASNLIGPDRVLGTIKLLRWCVEEQIYNCAQAFSHFRQMKNAGGFLPEIEQQFFCLGND
jgi:predicted nucleic acid-binding protein